MGAEIMSDTFTESEIQTARTVDQYRAQRRYWARERWRHSSNRQKALAVILAESGHGAQYIRNLTGIQYEDALKLVTGE